MTNKRPLECRTITFTTRIANFCQTSLNNANFRLLVDQLLNSCVTVGVAVRDYEYANSISEMIDHLRSAQAELRRTQYWLDLLREVSALQVSEYDMFLTETTELIQLSKETIQMIQA